MPDRTLPEGEREEWPTDVSDGATVVVARLVLERIHAHLTSVYHSYQTRRLRQAIMILEHLLRIRR